MLETNFAFDLRQLVCNEFLELKVYDFHRRPIGPHTKGMFEVNLSTPAQFGAFVPWLATKRGLLSVLIHPHTGDAYGDHATRATWMGEKLPLKLDVLKPFQEIAKGRVKFQRLRDEGAGED